MKKLTAFLTVVILIFAAPAADAGPAKDRAAAHRAKACKRNPKFCKGSVPPKKSPKQSSGSSNRRIEISIANQRLQAFEGRRVVLSTAVSTGTRNHPTPRGKYSVLSKETRHWSKKYGVWMPYAMRIVGGIFIHEVPISASGRRSGVAELGNPASHGCIRVGIGPAQNLFNWARIGTPVLIQ